MRFLQWFLALSHQFFFPYFGFVCWATSPSMGMTSSVSKKGNQTAVLHTKHHVSLLRSLLQHLSVRQRAMYRLCL
ncbi:hypothetical protein X975_20180, partial [Stegodyphus mimosarum]